MVFKIYEKKIVEVFSSDELVEEFIASEIRKGKKREDFFVREHD